MDNYVFSISDFLDLFPKVSAKRRSKETTRPGEKRKHKETVDAKPRNMETKEQRKKLHKSAKGRKTKNSIPFRIDKKGLKNKGKLKSKAKKKLKS